MATLYTRIKKNSEVVYYGNAIVNGKRYRKRLATSREAALKELKRWEYEILFQSPEPATKDQPITKARISFLKDLELSSKLCNKYFNVFSYTTRRFMEYCHKHNAHNLDEVTSELARSFFHLRCNTRTTSKYKSSLDNYNPRLSSSTLNKELQILKRFFNYCMDMEWVEQSPFRSVKAIKKKGSGGRYYFSDSDIKMIMESAGRFYDFYYLLLHTGIRCTDAYKLKPKHFEGRYLKVQMNKTGDFLHVPIAHHVLDVLQPRMANCTLFAPLKSDRQRRNCVKNIQRLFEPDFVRTNNINLHTFRHTYAHNMLNKGVPKEVLQTLLGHRSIKTTEIYVN
jgi:site-specific recombinase XerD